MYVGFLLAAAPGPPCTIDSIPPLLTYRTSLPLVAIAAGGTAIPGVPGMARWGSPRQRLDPPMQRRLPLRI